jgi:DNA polymerase-4
MRRILHIDMDAFFAAVEQRRHPELAGKSVVIGGGGDPTKRGVVSTASYEARKYGIHSAMPLKTAHRLCPNAVFLTVDYEEYVRWSEKIKSILKDFTQTIEDVGIDEAYLDISHIDKTSEDIAREIKMRINDETGLTCSIGIAPNKLLAKIASDLQKPDGLTIILERDIKTRIWPLPVRKIWGVGPKTEAHLKAMGLKTIRELAALSREDLVDHFGKSFGQYLFEASKGIDTSPLITEWEPKSTGREMTFQRDIDDWSVLLTMLEELLPEVVNDMKRSGYRGKTVTVKIKYSDFQSRTRAKTLDRQTDDLEIMKKTARECLSRFDRNKKVRLIGIRIGGLDKR